MYGFGMAFFYLLSGLASHPTTAITFGYLMNLLGMMVPLYFVSRILFLDRKNSTLDSILLPLVSAFLILFCLQLEKTTSGVLKIHADTPALSFILIGLCFFQLYESKKSNKFLVLTTLSLSLAIWSKLPTLPALFFPFIYLLLNRKIKESLYAADTYKSNSHVEILVKDAVFDYIKFKEEQNVGENYLKNIARDLGFKSSVT